MDYNAGMKFFFRFTAIILFFLLSSAGFASDLIEYDEVRVYTEASPDELGRAVNRSRRTVVPLEDFKKSVSLDTSPEGIETAVLVEASVKKALDELLNDKEFVIIENSVFRRLPGYDAEVYGFTWDMWGFETAFSFERTNAELMQQIEKVYGDDAYLYGELKRGYDDNYSLKIYRAEDLFSPADHNINFLEAMISATVIGSTFQPLLGIHDGLGVLDSLGLASVKADMIEGVEYTEYRKYEFGGERIYSFIKSVSSMEGDFIQNLYDSVRAIALKHSEDGMIMLPEEFFSQRNGDNSDYSMFYYDILKRMNYKVKYIVIDPGDGNLYSTVFFREKGSDLWGRIDGNILEREKASKWQRLPALVFSASVQYFEPDLSSVIEARSIELPAPSKWALSPY